MVRTLTRPPQLVRPVLPVRSFAMVALTALALMLGAACDKPSSDNIQLWKTTQKGPDRLHDALADHGVTPRLRAEAAVALVDIGQAETVDTTLTSLPSEDRVAIAKELQPLCEVAMKDPAPDKALAYRDALYSLRQFVPPDEQKGIDAALLPALEADLKTGHLQQGRHSVDKMLTAIGTDAGVMLARVLAEPDASYPQAAELLGKVGNDQAREAGGVALVARAKTDKTERRVDRHLKGKEPDGAIYKALGVVGGPTAVKFLEDTVLGANKDDAAFAVRALQERRDPAVLPFALKVAADTKADKIVRDEMFGVIETVGGLEALRGLTGIISSDREEIVRYRAFESALTAAKLEAIGPALEAFPASTAYKKVDVDDLLVKLLEKLGQPARPALVKTLESQSALARMTAVLALEQVGRAPDADAVQKLASDSTPVKGFPAGDTIGKEAARVAAVLKTKT
jgi:HEAT repeat protein